MKALSIHQPWAGMIVTGNKHFETRGRLTHYRGRIAIHATKAVFTPDMGIWPRLPGGAGGIPIKLEDYKVIPYRSAVIGFVDIVGCEQVGPNFLAELSELEHALGHYETVDGPRYAYWLDNPVQLTMPIPMNGMQGMWNCDLREFGYE